MSRPNARTDPSIKCGCCGQRMRFNPTPKSPKRRRQAPHANVCTTCKPGTLAFRIDRPRCERRGCNIIDALGDLGRTLTVRRRPVGHANYANLSLFFVRRLYAKGKLTITECVAGMQDAHEAVEASEGNYHDRAMLAQATEEIVGFLAGHHLDGFVDLDKSQFPVIVPVEPLTPDQQRVLDEWKDEGAGFDWDCGEDGTGGQYGILDSIQWKYAPGWRNRYPEIPMLGSVTH